MHAIIMNTAGRTPRVPSCALPVRPAGIYWRAVVTKPARWSSGSKRPVAPRRQRLTVSMRLSTRIGRGLSAKLTRITLDRFIASHATTRLTADIGAQNGPYAEHFPRRIGIDIRPGAGVSVIGDAQALGIRDGAFEVVLCTEVLEHLPDPQRAVDEMFRVLEPGGELLLTTRFLFPIHDAPRDYFRFTKYGLRHLLRRFEIIELHEETDTVGTIAVLLQRLGMQAETLGWQPLRVIWLVAAHVVRPFAGLITAEYGESQRRSLEHGIMTSGYHVACRKPTA
jgi:SAM-dependent methyltransferase